MKGNDLGHQQPDADGAAFLAHLQHAAPVPAKFDEDVKEYDFPELKRNSPLVELTMDRVRGDIAGN